MTRRLALLSAVVTLLTACSTAPTDTPASTSQPMTQTPSKPESVEESFAKIAALKLDADGIDAYLLERALNEGPVTLYLNSGAGAGEDIAEAWSRAFSEAYPGLAMQFVALAPSDFNPRVLSEFRSGRPQADVLRTSSSILTELRTEGVLASHSGVLQSAGVPDWTVTPIGVVSRVVPTVIAWNSARLPQGSQPDGWDDFLLEEHAGCSLGPTPSWIVGMIADRGFEATVDWFEAFIENGGRMVLDSGATLLRQMVAGEIDCVVHVSAQQAEVARQTGAPVDWLIPESSPAVVTAFSITTTTPRPHAAALFVRWAVSQKGAEIPAAFGETSVRTDVAIDSERLAALRDPFSAEFARLIVIDLDVAARYEPQAAEILARYHTPNVVRR